MQEFITPRPGRSPGPNLVNTDDYKMHVLKREYQNGEWEILIERWIPETGWTRTQLLLSKQQLEKFNELTAV
jgi:hypothetical protein